MADENNHLRLNLRHGHSQKEQRPAAAKRDAQAETIVEQYHYYYNRIYPLLKEGKLDFHRIAGKTNLRERRIRETLLFRLTSGEVMQLFGCKTGFCYICGCKTYSPSNKEPVCINCLKTLDTAIQEIHMADIAEQQKKQTTYEIPALEAFPQFDDVKTTGEKNLQSSSPIRDSGQESVSRLQYEQLMQELTRYRELFGPLPSLESVPSTEQSPAEPEPPEAQDLDIETIDLPEESLQPYQSEIDPLLKMLALDDKEVMPETIDLQLIPQAFSKEPLRHFGFQRLKGGNV
jgi:hypothetical protein